MKRASPGSRIKFILDNVGYSADACLIWPFSRYRNGYGRVGYDGKDWVASRLMCYFVHGPAPTSKHEAAHNCGRGSTGCISPLHLGWKTRIENQQDRIGHGTSNRGSTNGSAKLSELDVKKIVLRLRKRETQRSIAADFGVAQTVISQINLGKKWAWLTGAAR